MQDIFRFVVLIPHRDYTQKIEPFKQKLFAEGCLGAYSFPVAAPLALVNRALTKAELKTIAHAIRKLTLTNDGKVTTGEIGIASFGLNFLGLKMVPEIISTPVFQIAPDAILTVVNPPVLAVAVISDDVPAITCNLARPSFFFRAASVANIVVRPLAIDGYSFEWKIGIPVWMPAYK
jgi:hypothetical protein